MFEDIQGLQIFLFALLWLLAVGFALAMLYSALALST
jgi:hypothetical protein